MEWACTIKEKYFEAFWVGRKRVEVRKRLPKIVADDILYICCKDEVVKCRVEEVAVMDKVLAWDIYSCIMCVEKQKYDNYLLGHDDVGLVWVRVIGRVTGKELLRFRSAVSRNPQWFSKVKF